MKKINLCFFALLILFTQVIICDNLIYFFKASYLIGNIIALIVNIGIFAILIRKKKIKIETNFNKFDLIFIAILLVITGLTIIYPDTFWDSYSYHIYLQQNPFADKINSDFFPGRTLTSFVYPIADRIFYMFRTVLGFRLGTLPGYFLIAVMFYQIKKYFPTIAFILIITHVFAFFKSIYSELVSIITIFQKKLLFYPLSPNLYKNKERNNLSSNISSILMSSIKLI